MPKFNLDINLTGAEIAEARQDWSGPLPPKGSYPAKLKVAQFKEINGKEGQYRISLVAILDTGDKYDGCPVFGSMNLGDKGAEFINQWLFALAGGDQAAYRKLQTAFEAGPVVDEKKENITKIGTLKVNSPEGELPVLISLRHNTYQGNTSCKIGSFLVPGSNGGSSTTDDDDVVEEDDVEDDTVEDDEDESLFEDEDEDDE